MGSVLSIYLHPEDNYFLGQSKIWYVVTETMVRISLLHITELGMKYHSSEQ